MVIRLRLDQKQVIPKPNNIIYKYLNCLMLILWKNKCITSVLFLVKFTLEGLNELGLIKIVHASGNFKQLAMHTVPN